MFHAEMLWFANGPTLKMEGSLAGEWAEQARCLVTAGVVPKALIVDLTEVIYVDSSGERLLSWLGSLGAVFAANSAYSTAVCEHLGFSPSRGHLHGNLGARRSPQCRITMQVDIGSRQRH